MSHDLVTRLDSPAEIEAIIKQLEALDQQLDRLDQQFEADLPRLQQSPTEEGDRYVR
jgi:hypothetical protein